MRRIIEAERVGSKGIKARRIVVDSGNGSPHRSTDQDRLTSIDGGDTGTQQSTAYAPFIRSNAPTTAIDARRTNIGSESFSPQMSSKGKNVFSH
jgi:hypothetical protein